MEPNLAVNSRQLLYGIVITLAAGLVAGHILSVTRLSDPYLYRTEEETQDVRRNPWPRNRPAAVPTLGDNDRSRWDTVRALVDQGTYAVGHRTTDPKTGTYQDSGYITEDGWKTIDKVLIPETQDFCSSKPPLLPTLVAGEYWVLKHLFGWSIVAERWNVVRTILMTINWLPMILYLVLLARLLERCGRTDWGRMFVLAAAAFGTLLTSFAVTFNNHSIATCTALFALYPLIQVWDSGDPSAAAFLTAGFFAGFTACTELPAAALAGLLLFVLLLRFPKQTLLLFVPALIVPGAAFLVTNYLAIGKWSPAYAEFGSSYYEYAGSHWLIKPGEPKFGIDWAYLTESRTQYGFHVLLGHHGLFSLTPIFLLSVLGMGYGLWHWRQMLGSWSSETREDVTPSLVLVPLMTLVVTIVVTGFYIGVVNDRNRNYGGWANGPRWLMWLTPLLLLTMLPITDCLGRRRWGRGLGYLLLGFSVFSASYRDWTPWRHPWIYDFVESHGWINY
jgi:hypothetical protein